jgi:Domain of unknown function (DUF4844)
MNAPAQIQKGLQEFIQCDKFSTYGHLQPAVMNSTEEDKLLIHDQMNKCCNELLEYIRTGGTATEDFRKIMYGSVEIIEDMPLDTEDREFCYELYAVLENILGVSLKDDSRSVEQTLMDQLQRIAKKGGINLSDFLPPGSTGKQ